MTNVEKHWFTGMFTAFQRFQLPGMWHGASADNFWVVQIQNDNVFERRFDVRQKNDAKTTSDADEFSDFVIDVVHLLDLAGVGVRHQNLGITCKMRYSECLIPKDQNLSYAEIRNRREFRFQTTFWPIVTERDQFGLIYSFRPHLVRDFLVQISDSVQNLNCPAMELKPAVWIPNQLVFRHSLYSNFSWTKYPPGLRFTKGSESEHRIEKVESNVNGKVENYILINNRLKNKPNLAWLFPNQ